MRSHPFSAGLLLLAASACQERPGSEGDDGISVGVDDSGSSSDSGVEGGESDKLDVLGGDSEGAECGQEGGDGCLECDIPDHEPCDQSTSPVLAIGLNCPGEPEIMATTDGHPGAIGVRSSFGNTTEWAPREGQRYAVLGSGFLAELDSETPQGDFDAGPTYCNDDLGNYDPGANLPPPLVPSDVGAQTCAEDPSLIGMGDCSNTIETQWLQGGTANDYTELRFSATVPSSVNSFSYDFAFFSVEYPDYYQSAFNDMYIGWLESEAWTGNISFDTDGNPISLNAGFLDFRDAQNGTFNDPQCQAGCVAPELHGTCMKQHAGTKWLSTTAGVVPGEQITVVFGIFDMSDSILDSYVFLDNFQWGCEGDQPPSTKPVG